MADMDNALSLYKQLGQILSDKAQIQENVSTRQKALQAAKQLVAALEEPKDVAFETILWATYAVCSRVAIQLGLYRRLTESQGAKTVAQLAEEAQAQPLLVERVLRVISVVGLVKEVDCNVYAASPVTEYMAGTAMTAAGTHFWDQSANCMAKLPEFLEQRGLTCPNDPQNGLYQYAFNTELEAFEKWSTDAKVFNNFNTHLGNFHRLNQSWLSWFPVESHLLKGLDQTSAVIVDVGGGKGQNVQEFSDKFPQEKGKIVLQDRASVINDIGSLDENIERQAHDFFTPQAVKGARSYFFSRIFHDWSDEESRRILQSLAPAMKQGYSKLLIHDFVMSDTNCARLQAGFDIHMMCMHAGMERTRSQWTHLLHSSGFKILNFWTPPDDGEGIIEAEISA